MNPREEFERKVLAMTTHKEDFIVIVGALDTFIEAIAVKCDNAAKKSPIGDAIQASEGAFNPTKEEVAAEAEFSNGLTSAARIIRSYKQVKPE